MALAFEPSPRVMKWGDLVDEKFEKTEGLLAMWSKALESNIKDPTFEDDLHWAALYWKYSLYSLSNRMLEESKVGPKAVKMYLTNVTK